jgi:large subunit ribosomal protein L15
MFRSLQSLQKRLSAASRSSSPVSLMNWSLATQLRAFSTAPQPIQFLKLNMLHDNPGAIKKKRRVGRGIGSSKGKTCGRGTKGQKSRSGGSIHPLFEGGQTPFYKTVPKRGFNNKVHKVEFLPINLGTVQNYIDMKRLDPNETITLFDMQEAGMFKPSSCRGGVKLLGDGKERLKQPIHIKVSRASEAAIEAVESKGGTVTCVHYNELALRVLLRPQKFEGKLIPRQARPPPKWQPYYSSWKNRGYLNPAVQMREVFRQKPEIENKFDELLREHEEKDTKEEEAQS